MLTQKIREKQMNQAIDKIRALDTVHGEIHRIRVEPLDVD
jgi:hypothetical protein